MVLYNIYIFDRDGICLYYWEWSRPKSIRPPLTPLDDQKNLYGLFFSMKTFAAALDPNGEGKPLGAQARIGEGCSFHSFRTNNYKLHFFESPSGIKIVLNTDNEVGDLKSQLAYIYECIYVEYVIKNPLYLSGRPVDFELFSARLNSYVRSLGL